MKLVNPLKAGNSQTSYLTDDCSYVSWNFSSRLIVGFLLAMLCLNVCSISNKFAVLVSNLSLTRDNFSFIAVTENWLKQDSDFGDELPGPKSVSVYRISGNCG